MLRTICILYFALMAISGFATAQGIVRTEADDMLGPCALTKQTRTAALQDYIQAWGSMKIAFDSNHAQLLDGYFVGAAKNKLTSAIQQQTELKIHTRYIDRQHVIQCVLYSPEGASIELIDNAQYEVQILEQGAVKGVQVVSVKYLVVLTPAEAQWKVRMLQAMTE